MVRHRIRRVTLGKDAIQKSITQVKNIGQGTATINEFKIVQTDVGARSTLGNEVNIIKEQTTGNTGNVGNIIKYVNVCIEVASRSITGGVATPEDNGWLEYAVVKQKEGDVLPAVTNFGTQTLGVICNQVFRGDCIWSGCIPIGSQQPIVLDMKIKIPKIFQKLQRGSKLSMYYYYRSVSSADVRTDSHRIIVSTIYKLYV